MDSKFLKQRTPNDNCKLIVRGDWNDGDYITEDSNWSKEEINEYLPYLSIMLDLFDFDNKCRQEESEYEIDIRLDEYEALEFYLNYKKGFHHELLNLKNDKKLLSERVIALDNDEFEELYKIVITDVRENLIDKSFFGLPTYDGFGIHSVKEIYVDYKGNKYDILPGKTLEALAELMDREYDNFS